MPTLHLDLPTSLRLGLLALQFVSSLIALSTSVAGFRRIKSFDLSSQLGSHSFNFTLLLTYTTLLYSFYQLVVVEVLRRVPRTERLQAVAVDGVLALLLLICGIVFATSDYVHHCDSYGYSLRCNNLKTGAVFVFIACGAFLCTAVLNFIGRLSPLRGNDLEAGENDPTPYVQESTPTAALSPMGGADPTISTKV